MNNPCRICTFETGRYPGCSAFCNKKEYVEYTARQTEIKTAIREAKDKEVLYHDCKGYTIGRLEKIVKRY